MNRLGFGNVAVAISTLLLGVSTASATTIYVDDDAPLGGDGASWVTAYTYLQDALAAAGDGTGIDEIRVAQGVYFPDDDEAGAVTEGDRELSFTLESGVAISWRIRRYWRKRS